MQHSSVATFVHRRGRLNQRDRRFARRQRRRNLQIFPVKLPTVRQVTEVGFEDSDVSKVIRKNVEVCSRHRIVTGDQAVAARQRFRHARVVLLFCLDVHAHDLDVVGRSVLELFSEIVAPDFEVADAMARPQHRVGEVDRVKKVVEHWRLGGLPFDVVEHVDAQMCRT